uniref:Vesicle associated membrane protein 1 n=1 Tax=Ornithorhynchus anatinus TaxID=9258 RepID=A0A6I8NUK1_ORNAN
MPPDHTFPVSWHLPISWPRPHSPQVNWTAAPREDWAAFLPGRDMEETPGPGPNHLLRVLPGASQSGEGGSRRTSSRFGLASGGSRSHRRGMRSTRHPGVCFLCRSLETGRRAARSHPSVTAWGGGCPICPARTPLRAPALAPWKNSISWYDRVFSWAHRSAPAQPPTPGGPEGAAPGGGPPGPPPNTTSNRRLQQTQAQVEEVVDIMRVNVDKVLERDQKLSELDDRADALQAGASQFESSAAKLKRKYWWKNCKMMIMLGAICAIIVVIIVSEYRRAPAHPFLPPRARPAPRPGATDTLGLRYETPPHPCPVEPAWWVGEEGGWSRTPLLALPHLRGKGVIGLGSLLTPSVCLVSWCNFPCCLSFPSVSVHLSLSLSLSLCVCGLRSPHLLPPVYFFT